MSTWAHNNQFDDYASTAHYEYGFKENNEVIKKIAGSHNVYFFDFAEKMPENKKYWSDGRHLNYEGNLLKAKLFGEYIQENRIIHRKDNIKTK